MCVSLTKGAEGEAAAHQKARSWSTAALPSAEPSPEMWQSDTLHACARLPHAAPTHQRTSLSDRAAAIARAHLWWSSFR